MSEILDLPCVKNTPSTFERFYLLSLIVREGRPSLKRKGRSPPSFDTATFCVDLAVVMRTCVTHDIAGSTGFFLLFVWRFEQKRPFLQIRQDGYRVFPLLTCNLYLRF